MLRRLVPLLLAALVLGACGGEERAAGQATLWVTRDRGAQLLLETRVPAGQTLMRALRSRADVDTRYGGRFVQAIDGVEGSLGGRRDWFWFVNGIEGDRSAAEYRLHAGDVAWWDYRSWSQRQEEPVVVGAFPEPFLHGWRGRRRPAAVRYAPGLRDAAQTVARTIGAGSLARFGTPVRADANLFVLERGPLHLVASLRRPGSSAGSPVVFRYSGPVAGLERRALRRYALP